MANFTILFRDITSSQKNLMPSNGFLGEYHGCDTLSQKPHFPLYGPAVRRAETTKGRARRGQSPRTSELPTEEKRATAAYHSAGRGALGTIATQHQRTAAVPIALANTHESEDP